MPRHAPGGPGHAHRAPDRPAVHRITRRDLRRRQVARRGAGTLGILTSALAGGGLVAAHGVVFPGETHTESLALQSFSATPAHHTPSPTGFASSPSPSDGALRALAEPPPPVDVETVVGAATDAVTEAAQRRAAEQDAAAPTAGEDAVERGPRTCPNGTDGLAGVAPGVARAGELLRCMFGVDDVIGIARRANSSDHPGGKALDFMVDKATGDALAEYAREHRDELGISYIIWWQQIDTGDGWEQMEDRGGDTANHIDHVHISFD